MKRVITAICCLIVAGSAWGQSTYGALTGTVKDPSGAVAIQFANFGGMNGAHPINGLAQIIHHGGDGPRIIHHGGYAMAPGAGANQQGVLFAFDAKTGTVTPFYQFTGQADGGKPKSDLLQFGTFYYGTTYQGGGADSGTVFRFPAP